MTLISFRPSLNGIGNMFAQQTCIAVEAEKISGLIWITGSIDSTQSIQRRTIPEGGTALLCEQTVVGPHLVGEERSNGSLGTIVDAYYQRHTDPGTKQVIPLIITIGMIALHIGTEVRLDTLLQIGCATLIQLRQGRRFTHFATERNGRDQSVVIKCGRTQIGFTGRETTFQFIMV